MSTEVFVSYSNQDYERVMPLVGRLRDAGVAVWVDEGSIDAATLWSESIVEAIAECRVLIMMVSSYSTDSHNVVKEVMIASEGKKTILPIYLEPAEIPAKLKYQLTGIQHIEWFGGGSDEVFDTLKDGLAKRGVTIDGKVPVAQTPDQAPKKTTRKLHRAPNRTAQPSSLTKNIALATLAIAFAILCIQLMQSSEKTKRTIEKKPIHLPVNLPEGEKFYFDLNSQFHRSIAVSPDGRYFAFVTGEKPDANHNLWLHSLQTGEQVKVASTALLEGIYDPFFSPSSEWLVFYDNGKMKRISTVTKEQNIICDASLSSGGIWGGNNSIYFSPNEGTQLRAIDISKSNEPLIIAQGTKNSKNEEPTIRNYIYPDYLPDEKGILFFDFNENISSNYGKIYHLDLKTNKITPLISNGFCPRYSTTGHILYIRDNTLRAREFDISSLSVGSDEVTLLSGIKMNVFWGNAEYSISNEGTLAYLSGTNIARGKFAWVTRNGEIVQIDQLKPDVYCRYALNSTGLKVAVPVARERADIFVLDFASGASTPITRKDINHQPVWSPNDSEIIFTKINTDQKTHSIMQTNADGSGTAKKLYETDTPINAEGWASDGTKVSIVNWPTATGFLDLQSDPPTFKELASSDGTSIFGINFSPNGKWISFGSSITGGYSCYIAPIDKPDQAVLISKIHKGEEPMWSPKGDEIFYRGAKGLYSVSLEFDENGGVKIGNPALVVNVPWIDNPGIGYAVHPSGEKFLVVMHEKEEVVDHFNIVLNFDALIEQKFAELKNNSQP